MVGRRQLVPGEYAAVYDGYAAALQRAPLDGDTQRAYASRVRGLLAWLATAGLDGQDPLEDAHSRTSRPATTAPISRPCSNAHRPR